MTGLGLGLQPAVERLSRDAGELVEFHLGHAVGDGLAGEGAEFGERGGFHGGAFGSPVGLAFDRLSDVGHDRSVCHLTHRRNVCTVTYMNEAQLERAVDHAVMRRLATDPAYRNAEDAEAQAAREQEITDEECARFSAPSEEWS